MPGGGHSREEKHVSSYDDSWERVVANFPACGMDSGINTNILALLNCSSGFLPEVQFPEFLCHIN